MVFNNKTNKIKANIDRNMMETYNHNDGNNGSNSRHPKLINFSNNNRSNHSEQFTKAVIIISNFFDNTEIGDILSLLMKIYDYNDGNSNSNYRHLKPISFSINNR